MRTGIVRRSLPAEHVNATGDGARRAAGQRRGAWGGATSSCAASATAWGCTSWSATAVPASPRGSSGLRPGGSACGSSAPSSARSSAGGPGPGADVGDPHPVTVPCPPEQRRRPARGVRPSSSVRGWAATDPARAARARALRRLSARRSSSDRPPQTPASWPLSSAHVRQASTTAQRRQTAFASSICISAGPVLPIGKNSSGSSSRQAAPWRQSMCFLPLCTPIGGPRAGDVRAGSSAPITLRYPSDGCEDCPDPCGLPSRVGDVGPVTRVAAWARVQAVDVRHIPSRISDHSPRSRPSGRPGAGSPTASAVPASLSPTIRSAWGVGPEVDALDVPQ